MPEHVCDQAHFHVVIHSQLGYSGPSVATILETGERVTVEPQPGERMMTLILRAAAEVAQDGVTQSESEELAAWEKARADSHGGAWTTSLPGYPGILLHCCEMFNRVSDESSPAF